MTFTTLCAFTFFYWIHDVISTIKMKKYNNSSNLIIQDTVNFTKLFFFFLPIKLIWLYTSIIGINYLDSFEELSNLQVLYGLFSGLEFCYSCVLIFFLFCFLWDFISRYLESLECGIKCSFSFFKKISLISEFDNGRSNISYVNQNGSGKRIYFSFPAHILACFMLNKKYKRQKEDWSNKKQQEFYEMVIQDLQEKQKENEKKAQEYLSHAQKNEEDILDNFHRTLELQKKRK